MERPLYSPALKTRIAQVTIEPGEADSDAAALYSQVRLDKAALSGHVRQMLQTRTQISLGELIQSRPLAQGLGELVAYLQLASESPNAVVDDHTLETVVWQVTAQESDPLAPKEPKEPVKPFERRARLPRVIFVKP